MTAETNAKKWFKAWETGDFLNLPISDDFEHTSPYGTITTKTKYLQTVIANRDKFLGHEFRIHDSLYTDEKASIRYTAIKDDFKLEVSEWHYCQGGLINKIVAYYNIEGEISESRKLDIPD